MVPLAQISSQNDFIFSQSNKQKEILQNCTRLSIDNNHKASPWWAERTLSMRGLLHNKEWFWIGDACCLRKDEDIHRRLAKVMFDKACTCAGSGRGCVLGKIKSLSSVLKLLFGVHF